MSLVAITPEQIMPAWGNALNQAVMDGVNMMLPIVLADFEATVETWKNKPVFGIRSAQVQGSDLIGGVGTNDEIYGYVNDGTRPHDIYPVKAKALRFLSVYQPKTAPGRIESGPGGASGDAVFAMGVHHPGTQGRHFDQQIIKVRQPQIEALILKLLQQASAKRG